MYESAPRPPLSTISCFESIRCCCSSVHFDFFPFLPCSMASFRDVCNGPISNKVCLSFFFDVSCPLPHFSLPSQKNQITNRHGDTDYFKWAGLVTYNEFEECFTFVFFFFVFLSFSFLSFFFFF